MNGDRSLTVDCSKLWRAVRTRNCNGFDHHFPNGIMIDDDDRSTEESRPTAT